MPWAAWCEMRFLLSPAATLIFASAASPEQVKAILNGSDFKYIPKAAEFGTVEIHPSGGGHIRAYDISRR